MSNFNSQKPPDRSEEYVNSTIRLIHSEGSPEKGAYSRLFAITRSKLSKEEQLAQITVTQTIYTMAMWGIEHRGCLIEQEEAQAIQLVLNAYRRPSSTAATLSENFRYPNDLEGIDRTCNIKLTTSKVVTLLKTTFEGMAELEESLSDDYSDSPFGRIN